MKTLKTFEEVSLRHGDREEEEVPDHGESSRTPQHKSDITEKSPKEEAEYLAGAIENNLLICINKSVLNKSNKDDVEQTMSSIHEQVGQLRDLLKNL